MPYHVVAMTMAEVRQGSLLFQRVLGGMVKESPQIKVYSASPFALEERADLKRRFGGDIVYFFSSAARNAALEHGIDLNFQSELAETELPKRRTLVVGIPG